MIHDICPPPVEGSTITERCNWLRTIRPALTRQVPRSEASLIALAARVSVDPLWLATGQPSLAALAAQLTLVEAGFAVGDEALNALTVTPQPELASGTCRYCGCTGCDAWLDARQTICSACWTGDEHGQS